MPTSSIKKNFNVVGTRQLESFVKAVDRSCVQKMKRLARGRPKLCDLLRKIGPIDKANRCVYIKK